MNIAIVSPGPFTVPPVKGSSVEHDIDEVTKAMPSQHNITIYTRKCSAYPKSERKNNIFYRRLRYEGQKDYIKRVIKQLKKEVPPDIIMVENRPHFVLALRKVFHRTPIVLNMHSHVYATTPLISKAKMKKVVKQMDGLITNSNFLRLRLMKEHRIPEHKAHAVHLGVDMEPYLKQADSPELNKLRKKLGITANHRVLFFAGRLIPAKGVHVLLESFQKIAREDPKAILLIVGGTGYGSNRLNDYVKKLHALAKPIEKQVIFQNFVPSHDMPLYFQLGHVVATPSTWEEPFCRVNLEAMAAGKPVITTTNGGVSEVVKEGHSGFLIAPSDWKRDLPSIWEQMWKSTLLRTQMSKQALHRAAEFSWQATAYGYLNVFHQVMQQEKPAIDRQKHFLIG
ncbi:UNVERIFIED_CONTAM: spore coat protein SA [Brevibacillus sp. OAP136]